MATRTIEEINSRIRSGEAVVVTASEMAEIVKSEGVRAAFKKVDIVTTGTFGPMCSSGAIINFGHANPPTKLVDVTLNDVPAYGYLAAVDVYLGATATSESRGIEYGGGHVIEDLVSGKRVRLRARNPKPTDCYPGTDVDIFVSLETVNEAYLFNPRNAYQNYAAATNSSNRTLYTYMGTLLPRYGNVNFSTAGELSPLLNDPYYRTIGIGTRIFLGGGTGYVAWQGTQHNPARERDSQGIPKGPAGTLALIGDLKQMNPRFLRGATYAGYGCSLYVGVGIPIPVLDEDIARWTGLSDADMSTVVLDYSVASTARPVVRTVTYAELRSGAIEIRGKKVPTAPLTSYARSLEIAETLKQWIQSGSFELSEPVAPLPIDTRFKPLTPAEGGGAE